MPLVSIAVCHKWQDSHDVVFIVTVTVILGKVEDDETRPCKRPPTLMPPGVSRHCTGKRRDKDPWSSLSLVIKAATIASTSMNNDHNVIFFTIVTIVVAAVENGGTRP